MASGTAHSRYPVVGRQAEVDAVQGAITDCLDGRGAVQMFVGEPGIGKSTLARLAASRAEAAGVPVYWGFAWEAGGAPAYWPWSQLFTALITDIDPPGSLTAGLQQLLTGNPGNESESVLQPGQARFQLLESARRLLDSVSDSTPLVLILEDLHAADVDSLTLLQYVAGHIAAMPVLLIGTFRDIEARTMQGDDVLWQACRRAEVFRLQRLAPQDVRHFLGSDQPGAASDADVDALHAATEGNPLFLTELVDLLARDGGRQSRLPDSIQQVIRQQASLLPDDEVTLLGEAAVIGREFGLQALKVVSGLSVAEIGARLDRVAQTGLLEARGDGRYRFSHVLHRDVLYRDLAPDRRCQLHGRYADYLSAQIERGNQDRWSLLAEHLSQCGPDCRRQAVDAWRRAAAHASRRLAFDDAAASFAKALRAFGEGPGSDPSDRFDLLLECAEATFLAGDTETGYAHCRDALAIARALEDPTRMAKAALTLGGVIVVAKVSSELIAALQDCLDSLPESETGWRARVLARLAAALQPAPNPAEPVAMARDALTLARSVDDEDVLYEVLRFAIGALMDFASAAERRALNEKFAQLAERRGDVPGRFRSTLRLIIDCCELADRAGMDQNIEECRRLAERIGLPHYQWRAQSVLAMQATIDGQFSRASRLLDIAQGYADEADDVEARITLPLQRFAILIDWTSGDAMPLEKIEANLREAYADGMQEAEYYAAPFIETYKRPLTRQIARRVLGNTVMVQRAMVGGDRFSVCRIGEIAIAADDPAIAEQAFSRNISYASFCATAGLMGCCASGPISWVLARLAAYLGRADEALALIDGAIATAESMRAPVWLARIHWTAAEISAAAGDHAGAEAHAAAGDEIAGRLDLRRIPSASGGDTTSAPPPVEGVDLQQHGDMWRIAFGAASTTLRDSKGLQLLDQLLSQPGKEFHVLDLYGAPGSADAGHSGPLLDETARRQYAERVRVLTEEIEEAETLGDIGRIEAAREELEVLHNQLSGAYGLGGRERIAGSAAERARVNVRRRLKDAIDRIGEQLPDAGRFLENTIKTGTYCRYAPM